jgi:hypothetical protein
MKSKFLLFSIVFMILFSFSCNKDEKTAVNKTMTKIRYGTSFGECMGYCMNEMVIEQTNVKLKSTSWDTANYPVKQCQKSISAEKWNELTGLTYGISFNSLDSIYGCPDCADGGAEWVEITTPEWKHKVTVDYSGPNRPVVLEALLDSLRALKTTFKGCE